ncbi:MAG TPA: hypothetical protein VFD36_29550 [Kofleriaceae bacterium]|nr:hypothetical protein [Kofleriaceae bacterium]
MRQRARCSWCRRVYQVWLGAKVESYWCVRCARFEAGVDRGLFSERAWNRATPP